MIIVLQTILYSGGPIIDYEFEINPKSGYAKIAKNLTTSYRDMI